MARPREYDRETVLREAMSVFWGNGYTRTNMSQITEATDLKPGSLYSAFSSKEALFLDALDYYGQMNVSNIKSILDSKDSPSAGIRNLIDIISNEIVEKRSQGCFLVNTAIEMSERSTEMRDRVNLYLEKIRKLFLVKLKQAIDAGEISKQKDPEAMSVFILCTICGLRVLTETYPEKNRVDAIRNQLMAVIDN